MNISPAVRVADDGLAYIYSMQDGFQNLHALLITLRDSHGRTSTAHAIAELGIAEANDWLNRGAEWAEEMRVELDALNAGGVQ